MTEALATVARAAREESLYRGIRVLEVPARQLFEYDGRGQLAVHPDAQSNRRVLARAILASEACQRVTSGVSLRDSLKYDAKSDSGMLYAAGAKFVVAARADTDGVHVDGFAFVCNLKPAVVEPAVLRALDGKLPAKALYLELICATPRTGAATVVLLHLVRKLTTKTVTGVLAHAVNKKSRDLLTKHGYALATSRRDIFYLSAADARRDAARYDALLRRGDAVRDLCTRTGQTRATRGRVYWDCA